MIKSLSLDDWLKGTGYYESNFSNYLFSIHDWDSSLGINYHIEFPSKGKTLTVTIRATGIRELDRSNTSQIKDIFLLIQGHIEKTLDISINDNLFLNYVLVKIRRGHGITMYKMYISTSDLQNLI